MKKIIMLSLCALFTFSPHSGASSTDEAIRGVTTFLKERVNASQLFIFESKLGENEAFKGYFPETHANMKFASLEQLLLTGSEALSGDFELDLKNLPKEIVKSLLKNLLDDADTRDVNETLVNETLNSLLQNPVGDENISMVKFVCSTVSAEDFNDIFDKKIDNYNSTCYHHIETGKKNIASKSSSFSKLLHVLKEAKEVKKLSDDTWQEIDKFTTGAMFFASVSDVYKRGIGTTDSDSNSTKNEEAIAEILSSYALPVVSFRQKAERGSHIFISAYASFGFEVDYYDDDENAHLTDSVRQRSSSLLYVPVGVEIGKNITLGVCDPEYTGNWFFDPVLFIIPCAGSMDIMLSPFDFAYPWQQQSDSAEESFTLDDIWAPSVAVSLSSRKYPVVLGHGFQQTRYDDARGTYNDRRFWFLGIEMPLYRLY